MALDGPDNIQNVTATLAALLASTRAELIKAEDLLERFRNCRDPGINLVEFARILYKGRRLRDRLISSVPFAEPAWDILLDLFIAHHEGRHVGPSGLFAGASVPMATGIRWLAKLEAAGLIKRDRHPVDHRMVLISLTDEANDRMSAVLLEMAFQFPFKRLPKPCR